MAASRATTGADSGRLPAVAAVAAFLLAAAAPAAAQTELGGDVRLYAFRVVEEVDGAGDGDAAGEDAPGLAGGVELGILRLKLDSRWRAGASDRFRLEVHGAAQAVSPPFGGSVTSVATGGTRRFFDLTKDSFGGGDIAGRTEIDRLNLRWDRPGFRMVAGRQAITWGVNYFWPVLDLFAPFAPQRIDRDYKPGVDALRFTVPVGDFSEVEIVAAGQGERTPEDLSLASLGRFHAEVGEGGSSVDIGYMVGGFHRDLVLGGFFAADVRGTGLRGEVSWTSPGCDPASAHPVFGCGDFWRFTVGIDRLLTPTLTLIGEASWNGFGAGDPADYARLAEADRVRRGEVVSLGRRYAGLSLAWQAHPLLTVTGAALLNRDDGSALFQPGVAWSVSDNVTLTAGLVASGGRGLSPGGALGSEYGAVPVVAWSSLTAYF